MVFNGPQLYSASMQGLQEKAQTSQYTDLVRRYSLQPDIYIYNTGLYIVIAHILHSLPYSGQYRLHFQTASGISQAQY